MRWVGILIFIATELWMSPKVALAENSLSITPAKTEITMKAGESVKKSVTFTNRTESVVQVRLELQDMVGGEGQSLKLLKEATSPWTLNNYLKIVDQSDNFKVEPGRSQTVSYEITLPQDIGSGGRYGSLVFTVLPNDADQIKINTSIAALIFVRIDGLMQHDGNLLEFGVAPKAEWAGGLPQFVMMFQNRGDTHLNPYGYVSVRGLTGREVAFVSVEPWFVMPKALRSHTVELPKKLWPGVYTATLMLNRGYDDIIESEKVFFMTGPAVSMTLAGFLALIVGLIIRKKYAR